MMTVVNRRRDLLGLTRCRSWRSPAGRRDQKRFLLCGGETGGEVDGGVVLPTPPF